MAQELLTTFPAELGEVALVPGHGGVFEVRVDGETIWWRGEGGGFPGRPELNARVRRRGAPPPSGSQSAACVPGPRGPGISATPSEPTPPADADRRRAARL